MWKISFLSLLIFIICINIFPQVETNVKGDNGVRIDSIKVVGNKQTDSDIILRELTFKIGDKVDEKLLEYNRERIYTLGIFSSVDLSVKKVRNENVLFIQVQESWYIYPLPFVTIKDRDWKKLSYGINVIIKNFRGRNELLETSGSLGYDPSIYLSYYSPYLNWKHDIFFKGILSYSDVSNKSQIAEDQYGSPFSQRFLHLQLGVGKRFDYYNRAQTFLGFDYVSTPIYIPGVNASDGRIDRVPFVGVDYNFDSRDLAQFPKAGFYGDVNLTFRGMGFQGINYRILSLDVRKYNKLFDGVYIKERLTTRFTYGKVIPYYDFSMLGYEERIRGFYTLVLEGNNYYLGSIESYAPIVKDLNLNLDFIPLLPRELLHYRFAIYGEMFLDTGGTKLRGQKLSLQNFKTGYGLGLTFLFLPYNSFRLEFAMGHNKPQWILDLGTSF